MNQPIPNRISDAHREGILARILTVASPEFPSLSLASADSLDRAALERRIAEKFASQFGARIEEFLPYLVSLAVAGGCVMIRATRVRHRHPGIALGPALLLASAITHADGLVVDRIYDPYVQPLETEIE